MTPIPPLPFAQRYRRVLNDGTWVVTGQCVAAAAGLVGTRLITQVVPPSAFGLASLLMAGEQLVRGLCAPMLTAGVRYYPEAERCGLARRMRALLTRSMAKIVLVLLPLLVIGAAIYLVRHGERQAAAWWLGVYLVLDIARSTEVSILSGARKQKRAAVALMIETVARPMLILAAVWLIGSSAQAIVAGTAAAIAAALVILRRGAARDDRSATPVQGGSEVEARLLADIHHFARPLVPVMLIMWVTSLSDRYIIEWLVKDTAAVGIYSAGYGLISQPFIMVNAVLSGTLRPIYFTAVSHNNFAHARGAFLRWLFAAGVISGFGVVLAALLRKQVVRLFLAPRYAHTAEIIPWIAAGYFFYVLQQTMEQNLLAHKRTGAVLAAQAFGAVVSIVATIPLVRAFGALGAAYACPIYFGAECVLTGILARTPARNRAVIPLEAD